MLIIPLVLSPYLTRTIGDEKLGTFAFVNSIAYYYVILSNLGISRHGQRIISINSDNETALRKKFWSLFSLHIVISLFATVLYLTFILIWVNEDIDIYYIEALFVISALFDITWLFYGLEKFKVVVIRNGIIKVVECVLIFCLVHSPQDIMIYTLINASGILLGQVAVLPQAIKVIRPIKFGFKDCKEHIGPLLLFSISIVAATMYTVFDKTLLGLLSDKASVAYYEYSNRIINVPKVMISVIGTVLYPRACRLAAQGNIEGQKKYMSYSFYFATLVGVGAIFGLISVSQLFTLVYFGEEFLPCGNIIIALSPLILVVGIGDILRTQYMIPNHMDKQYTFCIIINAVINIVISLYFIPRIGVYGAIVGTISAELFGLVYQLVLCRKRICLADIIKPSIGFSIIGVGMFIVIRLIANYLPYKTEGLVIEIVIGLLFYSIIACIYTAVFNKSLWKLILLKINKLWRKERIV